MLVGNSTLNTVVLGEGMSKYQIPPCFGHHSSTAGRAADQFFPFYRARPARSHLSSPRGLCAMIELTSARPPRRPVLPIWADLFNIEIRVKTRAAFYRFGLLAMPARIRGLNVRALGT